jgi:putative membrane protein
LCFGGVFGAVLPLPTPWRRAGFHLAMLLAGLALFGPLDDLAERSTAWHMSQHMLLMVVVAPLLAMSRPGPQWRALLGPLRHAPGAQDLGPARSAGLAMAGALRRLLLAALRVLVQASRRPMACAMLHALAIWAWHAPVLYMAAVMDTTLHVLEHLSFLLTGVLFWWSVLQPGRHGAPQAALALLFTLMHTGLLGAALTFAPELLYWKESRELWDQQLAGLLMWVPGGTVYVLAAVWATGAWLQRQDSAPASREPAPGVGLVPQSFVVPADAAPESPSLQ